MQNEFAERIKQVETAIVKDHQEWAKTVNGQPVTYELMDTRVKDLQTKTFADVKPTSVVLDEKTKGLIVLKVVPVKGAPEVTFNLGISQG